MKVEVDEGKLKVLLEAFIFEQCWSDYAEMLDIFCEDVLDRNPELKEWAEKRQREMEIV